MSRRGWSTRGCVLCLRKHEGNSLRNSVKAFALIDRHLHHIRSVHQPARIPQPARALSTSPGAMQSRIRTFFLPMCCVADPHRRPQPVHAMRPVGLNFWGADPSHLGGSDISRVSGTGHVPAVCLQDISPFSSLTTHCAGCRNVFAERSFKLLPSWLRTQFVHLQDRYSSFLNECVRLLSVGCVSA